MAKTNLKRKLIFCICGLVWPFVIAALLTYCNMYLRYLPEWTFWWIGLPVMALGLIPVMNYLISVLPKKWPPGLRWPTGMIVTGGIGWGLFMLVMVFMFWFHFAIGGSC